MVINQRLLLLGCHRVKRIISSLKVTLKSGKGGSDELRDFVTLFLRDAGTKRVLGQVSSDTDTGAFDHLLILFGYGWAIQLSMVHIAGVTGTDLNLMVVFDDWGENIRESLIRVR